MDHREEPFAPENVDEQVAHFLISRAVGAQDQEHTSSAQMVRLLQEMYVEDPRLGKVWARLAEHVPGEERGAQAEAQQREDLTIVPFPQKKVQKMQQTPTYIPETPRKRSPLQRRLGLLAALVFTLILVGSLVTVLQFIKQEKAAQTGQSPVATPAPVTPIVAGAQVIYSATLPSGVNGFPAWSANGQRLAVSGTPVLIWDASNGEHRFSIPGNESFIAEPAWSPVGNLLAIPYADHIAVVDGQSGQVITSHPLPSGASASTRFPIEGAPLSDFRALSGGPTFGGLAWSPDGQEIASTFFAGTAPGLVQIWNAHTGQMLATLARQPDHAYDNVAWSSDGKYLAVDGWNWDSGNELDVWNAQTHQIIFQQTSNQRFYNLSWQPGTDNLATVIEAPGKTSIAPVTPVPATSATPMPTPAVSPTPTQSPVSTPREDLEIWNVVARQLVKAIPDIHGYTMAWSPDGKKLAYAANEGASIVILDAENGRQLHNYQVSTPNVQFNTPAWSPDGKDLAVVSVGISTVILQPATAPQPTQQSQGTVVPTPPPVQPTMTPQPTQQSQGTVVPTPTSPPAPAPATVQIWAMSS